jgi:hypothetical protein
LGDEACYEAARRGNAHLLQLFRNGGAYWSDKVLEAAIMSNNWATISYAIRHCRHTISAINLAFMHNCDAFRWFADDGLTRQQVCMLDLAKCRTRSNLLVAQKILDLGWSG